MIERTYFVLLNLDAFSAEMAGLDTTEERGQWVEGFQVGCHGHALRSSWSEIKMSGYHFGASALAEAEAHREKKVQAGKRSAQIRKDMKGSAQPEHRSNGVRASFGGCSEQTPEHPPEQSPEQTPNQPVTSNHKPIASIQQPEASIQEKPSPKMIGGPGGRKQPTEPEWTAYCTETWPDWHPTQAGESWAYYESVGWRTKAGPIKDWRSAARTAHGNAAKWKTLQPPAANAGPTLAEWLDFAGSFAIENIPFPEDPRYFWPEDLAKAAFSRHKARGWQGIEDWKSQVKADCREWTGREITNRKRPAK